MRSILFVFLLAILMAGGVAPAAAADAAPVATPAALAADWIAQPETAAAAADAQATTTAETAPPAADASGDAWWMTALKGLGYLVLTIAGAMLTGKGKVVLEVVLRLAAVLPGVQRYLDEGKAAVAKANAGAAAIVSVDVGRMVLQQIDGLVSQGKTVQDAIKILSGGKATTIEGLFVSGLVSSQIDQGQRVAIKTLREGLLDEIATRAGKPAVASSPLLSVEVAAKR